MRKSTSALKNLRPFFTSVKTKVKYPRTGAFNKQISPQPVHKDRKLSFVEHDEGISITFGVESRQLSFHWLRDHCRSESSYNHDTHQKIILPHQIDPNIKPNSINVEEDQLVIQWPEGLTSTYDPSWLLENAYPGPEEKIPKFIWDDAAISEEHLSSFSYKEFMNDDEVLKDFLKQWLKYGFVVVEGVLDDSGKANIETTKRSVICIL